MTIYRKDNVELDDWTTGIHIEVLRNGLTVCILPHPGHGIVATALCYAAGSRYERPGEEGAAHFLEHMMFKGSSKFPDGEIDRITQALGGSNNAFTSFDCTLYYFTLASDRWKVALQIEADRMMKLTLDPRELDSERKVIFEEIAHAEDDPWDPLDAEVRARLFGEHPYGRRILGSQDSLRALGGEELNAFHERLYGPERAVLAVVGDVSAQDLGEIRSEFEKVTTSAEESTGPRPQLQQDPRWPQGLNRVERKSGEVSRLIAAFPGASALGEDYGPLRLLLGLLAGGRSSRLYRELVDETQYCTSALADVSETIDPGSVLFALEVSPGADEERVEEVFWEVLHQVSNSGFTSDEIERGKRMILVDWVFGFETIQSRAIELAHSFCRFDRGFLTRIRTQLLQTTGEDLVRVASQYLRSRESAVVGWSFRARSAIE